MEDWIRNFFNNYINGLYFPTVHLTDVIEILIITVIVYEIMLWIKNTKAWMLLKGMIMLGAFFLLAAIFKMHTILFVAKESILSLIHIFCLISDWDSHLRHYPEEKPRESNWQQS